MVPRMLPVNALSLYYPLTRRESTLRLEAAATAERHAMQQSIHEADMRREQELRAMPKATMEREGYSYRELAAFPSGTLISKEWKA